MATTFGLTCHWSKRFGLSFEAASMKMAKRERPELSNPYSILKELQNLTIKFGHKH